LTFERGLIESVPNTKQNKQDVYFQKEEEMMVESGFPWKVRRREEPIEWPNKARIAIVLTVAFEWSDKLAFGHLHTSYGMLGPFPKDALCKIDFPTASMWEYGGKVGVWRILELLDRYGIKASFVTNGICAERYMDATKEIARRGHEITAHAYEQHTFVCNLNPDEEREMIRKTVSAIKNATGVSPVCWVSPMYRSSANTPKLLMDVGFIALSDYHDDDLPYTFKVNGKNMVVVPHSMEINDFRWFHGFTPMQIFEFFKDYFDVLYEEGKTHPKMMNVAMHPWLAGRPHRTKALEAIIKYAKSFPNVWFAKREEIARWWLERYAD
jgi:allantoinase